MMVLIEKSKWMVVNKPSGWHTLEGGDDPESPSAGQSLEAWLKKEYPQLELVPEAGIAHRLDQKTSGCLLVAKTPETYLSMRELIRSTELQKTYLAFVEGTMRSGKFEFYFTSRYKRSQRVTVSKKGKPQSLGVCEWKTLYSRNERSLIQIELIGRGKRHQIRAGLAELGHPICGDTLYGAEPWGKNFGLHAWRLRWKALDVKAPPPEGWPTLFTDKIPKD